MIEMAVASFCRYPKHQFFNEKVCKVIYLNVLVSSFLAVIDPNSFVLVQNENEILITVFSNEVMWKEQRVGLIWAQGYHVGYAKAKALEWPPCNSNICSIPKERSIIL